MNKHIKRYFTGAVIVLIIAGMLGFVYLLSIIPKMHLLIFAFFVVSYAIGFFAEKEDADCKQNETANETP